MRLLFISQLFDPEYSIKGLGFLAELGRLGFDVDVITTFPNYPTGQVFDGYRVRPWQIEHRDGIRIIRVWSWISHSKSKASRALTYITFMVSAFLACLCIKKPDVIYAYHPQLPTGFVAIFYKWLRRVPFITDVQDLWPDALAATGLQRGGWVYRLMDRLCRAVYRQAAHIVVLSNGYKAALVERSVDPEKIAVVYNWHADEAPVAHTSGVDLLPAGYRYHFMYAGNLGAAQALGPVIDAFASLKEESISLTLIGAGVERNDLEQHARTIGADNVFFLGYVSSAKIKAYLAQADVLVVHLRDEDLFKVTIPSKIQAYLSSGKPILMAVGGESNQIVDAAGAGRSAAPGDVGSIAAAARHLVARVGEWQQMGTNARAYYDRVMARHISVIKIDGILRAAARNGR